MIFDVVFVKKPTPKELYEGQTESIIGAPVTVSAPDTSAAIMAAAVAAKVTVDPNLVITKIRQWS